MTDAVLSVSQLNEYVRKQLAGDPMLSALRVRGEISGFKRHVSGHLYFAIKDEQARVSCVMFRQHALSLSFEPRDGLRCVVFGSASLYAASGSFQIYCEAIEQEGAGALHLRFEALKAKLLAEGLFDPARKRPLPLLPRRVGIVTSRSGAALRDMLRVIHRRHPGMGILLCAAQVQGEGAAGEIARSLDRLNAHGGVDVILCGRGGGSILDLWAFNEEIVARAIARSKIPVVSCVGHETDFTIADFAADVRAATPSMAAELAVPEKAALEGELKKLGQRMLRAQRARLALVRAKLSRLAASQALTNPRRAMIEGRRAALKLCEARIKAALRARTAAARAPIDQLSRALGALGPLAVLERGYALVLDEGAPVTSAARLTVGQHITLKLRDGRAKAAVDAVELEESHGGEEEAVV